MLKELFENQKKERIDLFFKHARELMDLITDEELLGIYEANPKLFSQLSNNSDNPYKEDMILVAISIFKEYLANRKLTVDEYNEMTLDEVIDYISGIINEKSEDLYYIIKELEDDSRNS